MQHKTILSLAMCLGACSLFAAPSCAPYTVVGSQCARTVYLGWGIAGQGTTSTITFYAPAAVSGPITFQMTQLNSSQGSAYTGFFGIMTNMNNTTAILTTQATGLSFTAQPGQGGYYDVNKTCFNSGCTGNPPASFVSPFVPNMYSMTVQILGNSASDLALVQLPLLTGRFVDTTGQVTLIEQETAVETPVTTAGLNDLNEAGTASLRYVLNGSDYTLPFVSFSVTNVSTTQTLSGTVTILDYNNNAIATASIPAIPASGSAGYLLIGRSAGDTAGLLPSTTVLAPVGPEGAFHGTLRITLTAPGIFLAQQFIGASMANLVIEP